MSQSVIHIETPVMLRVRTLMLEELPLCLPFAQAFYTEMKLPGVFRSEVFLRTWSMFLSPPYTGEILSLWKDGELIGGLGVLLAPDQNDGRLAANEFFWYIDPAHRGGTGALRLLKRFEQWAVERGAVECRLVHLLTGGEMESPHSIKLATLYRTLGYRPVEVAWLKPLTRSGEER